MPALASLFANGYDFANLLLPMGISYFSFKLIHYVLERSRGMLPQHSFWEYFAWVFFVPIFTAGPIQRFDLFMNGRSSTWDNQMAWDGLTRIAIGLIKKFVLGAICLFVLESLNYGSTGRLLNNLEDTSPLRVILFLCFCYLFVYMDFSGYTDIAIGTGRLFGLRIMENFNFPIFAPNIGNLWKRWHMSLASWCQSYIYMPTLGVSRSPYVAVFASFLVMGLWHAASWNWVAWGLYNAAGVAIYQKWTMTARKKKWRIIKTKAYSFAAYPLTFLFFAGSFAFTITHGEHGLYAALRILFRCFGIDI
nr:MBOAT family O-acyltransferase [Octadecabacter algicola]